MELIQDNSAAAKRREKCDFSVSSIIGLKEAPKRASTDERDSVGSSVGSDSGDSAGSSGGGAERSDALPRGDTHCGGKESPALRSRAFSPGSRGRVDGVPADGEGDAASHSSDDDGALSTSGDSGLLKDINENHKAGDAARRSSSNDSDPRGAKSGETTPAEDEHQSKYLNMNDDDTYIGSKGKSESTPHPPQQSDLSALQKLYSLESMARFADSTGPVFPGREPFGLPNYDKPLMIDVGPGRSYTGVRASSGLPGARGVNHPGGGVVSNPSHNQPDGEKIKKKAVVREAVDPAKYVRIQDLEGIKFACSKCGNTYKWRKSLNKHWKEKHDGEIPTPHGQNLITLNIPQVKGKTTNINTALFSYAPLGPQSQTGAPAGFPGAGIPAMSAGKKDPGYPSAEMLSKYEELSKQWMSFAAVAAAAGNSSFQSSNHASHNNDGNSSALGGARYSQKNSENHNGNEAARRGSSPDRRPPPPAQRPKSATPSATPARSGSETPLSTGSGVMATPPPFLPGHPFLLTAPPPAHSQSYSLNARATMEQQDCDDERDLSGNAPLDLSSKSSQGRRQQNSTKSDASDSPSPRQRSDQILDFSKHPASSVPLKQEFDSSSVEDPFGKTRPKSSTTGLYNCVVCFHPFNSISDLNQHFMMFHIDVIYEKTFSYGTSDSGGKTDDGTFSCIICGAKYLYQIEIVQHFEKNHSSLPNPYKKRANPGSLVGDYMTEPPNKKACLDARATAAQLQCAQCGFFARDPAELHRHHLVHSMNRPYACTKCGYSTKHQEDLIKHITKYHHHGDVGDLHASMMQGTEVLVDQPQEILVTSPNDIPRGFGGAEERQSGALGSGRSSISPDSGFGSAGSKRSAAAAGGAGVRRAGPVGKGVGSNSTEILLPYKCSACEYRARWPSEITQHMKNHSDEKPFHCPRCTYKSKWKWDVVKHLKRCGGGTVKDVIDTTKMNLNSNKGPHWVKALQFKDPAASLTPASTPALGSPAGSKLSGGPPNVTVLPSGVVKPSNPLTPSGGERHLTHSPPSPHTPDQLHQNLIAYQRADHTSPTQTSAKGLMNGLYHCQHCPFTGNSPAELKRHTRVHSDEKPFSCITCGYSSKWKCDLKKHLRTYNHQSAVSMDGKMDLTDVSYSSDEQMQSPGDGNHDSNGHGFDSFDAEPEDMSGRISSAAVQTKQLYKCESCQYVTYKKNFLETHMKIHEQPGKSKLNFGANKLRCKTCGYDAPDLSGFLQHQLTHNSSQTSAPEEKPSIEADAEGDPDQVSPGSLQSYAGDEIDTPVSKHRRKPVKQFRCARCPYTCFKRTGLEQHQAMHEPRQGSLVCRYCDYNVFSRSLLSQHMRLHPEYLQEVGGDDEASDDDDCITAALREEQEEQEALNLSGVGSAAAGGCAVFPGQTEEERRYPCEWCAVTCTQLSELYQHARAAHAAEYDAQEAACTSPTEDGNRALLSPFSLDESNNAFDTDDMGNGIAPPREDLCKSSLARMGKRKRKLLTCTDCGYTTDNSANLARHAVKHGQNATYRCHYCNYSLNRQGLVIAHMKQVHNVSVAALPRRSATGNDAAIASDENDADDIVAFPSEADKTAPNGDEPTGETDVVCMKGETILVVQSGNRKMFRCPKCAYSTANSGHCVNHVRQHGSNKRYSCELCDYSLDKLPHIIMHMKTAHAQHVNGGFHDDKWESANQKKVEPLVLNLNGLDAKKVSHDSSNASSALSVAKKRVRKSPQIKNRLLKKALAVFNGSKKNGLIAKRNRKTDGKRMACTLCPYHTNSPGLLQNHLLQHNAFAAI